MARITACRQGPGAALAWIALHPFDRLAAVTDVEGCRRRLDTEILAEFLEQPCGSKFTNSLTIAFFWVSPELAARLDLLAQAAGAREIPPCLLTGQRQADTGDDVVPVALFPRRIIDQHAMDKAS